MARKETTISKAHLATGRAVDQLRRQLGLVLTGKKGKRVGVCPVEGLSPALLKRLQKNRVSLLITGARARSLGIATKENSVRLDARKLRFSDIQAITDPLAEALSLKGFALLEKSPHDHTVLTLVKYASLLPGALLVEGKSFPAEWLAVAETDIAAYWKNPPLDIVDLAEAKLPIEGAENTRIICFQTRFGTSTHLALIFGELVAAKEPLVRIHSSCITGDLLGSLRCDCGSQLKQAIDAIATQEAGVLLYMHQEGRGIGIANKLRAYALQERGIDTYDANLMLGFEEDERDFSIAAAMLKHLGIRQCRLLTNNPMKIAALKKFGVTVTRRLPIIVPASTHNRDYLTAKAHKSGHLF